MKLNQLFTEKFGRRRIPGGKKKRFRRRGKEGARTPVRDLSPAEAAALEADVERLSSSPSEDERLTSRQTRREFPQKMDLPGTHDENCPCYKDFLLPDESCICRPQRRETD